MMRARALAMTAALAVAAVAAPASGDETKDCIAASTQGQNLRDQGHYRRARDQFQMCSRDACPAVIKQSCVGWLEDLENAWPSIVVNAKDETGADLVDVTVVIDGTPLVSRLDGKPQLVDPGEHDFHYETSGYPPVEEHLVIHAGEKSRVLSVQFGEGARPTRRGGGGGTGGGGGVPIAAWVLGGIALAAFGAEAIVGIPAVVDRSNLFNSPCGMNHTCDQGQVDSIRNRFVAADVFGVVGLVTAGIAIYLFATSAPSHETPKASRVDVAPLPGGGAMARWGVAF